ncbi:DUF5106 domain-containing protein [Marinilabiliaceae bacterium JC040]|nr:DUF5106 domain-containing protein [Marinilabiliaceae bacterium JC040]
MTLKYLFSSLILLISFPLFSQSQGYEIKINTKKNINKKIILANYYNSKVYSIDTAKLIGPRQAVFNGNKKLPSGLYVIILSKNKYYDLFIGKDQTIDIDIDSTINIRNSKESIAFKKYEDFLQEINNKKRSIIIENRPKKTLLRKKLQELDVLVRNELADINKQFPNTSLVNFINFSVGIKIPDYNNSVDKNIKNRKQIINKKIYNYNKKHFWDNANLSDSTLIRTPILRRKLDLFFKRILPQDADTISKYAIQLIEKTKNNKSSFRYITSYSYNYCLRNKYMGMDKAYYNIAKKYYASKKAYWISDSSYLKIKSNLNLMKYSFIGMKAKNLKMQNIDGEIVDLHNIKAPLTILIFWEPDCGLCKEEVPALNKLLNTKYKNSGIKVFSVYTLNNKQKWIEFIENHNLYNFINCYDPFLTSKFHLYYNIKQTPMIFLLDKNKKIIAKKINTETLDKIIKEYL